MGFTMPQLFSRGKNGEEGEAQQTSGADDAPGAAAGAQNEGGAPPLEQAQSFGAAIMPVMACGAGLFSDGYINNVSY